MKTDEIQVRPAIPAQVADCLTILMDSILGHYFEESLAARILTEAQTKTELIAATEGGDVVGFYVNASHGSFLAFPYLHLLAVKTAVRGEGIGAKLLVHLETSTLEAPGYPFRPKIFLLVAQDNEAAIRFYERHGYSRKAVIDDMFGEGDTEFLMMKDLGKKKVQ
jgi:ribosomal protein S18 acetylase RimI-like enzyme